VQPARPTSAPARVRLPAIKSAGKRQDDTTDTTARVGARALAVKTDFVPRHHNLADASPPTQNEIRDYGEFLGLDADADEEFMWIAEEALCAPLPAGWTEHFRQEYGAVYYFNSHTQESVWHHPLEAYYRTLLTSLKELKLELRLVQVNGNSLFAISQIGSKTNALMKAHNEKLATLLLDEDPDARLKAAHMTKLQAAPPPQ
jgi:hypothetical protein